MNCHTCKSPFPRAREAQGSQLTFCDSACQREWYALLAGKNERSDALEDLSNAISTNDMDTVRLLLRAGDVAKEDIPIELAKTMEMIRLLVDSGANLFRYVGQGKVALDQLGVILPINQILFLVAKESPYLKTLREQVINRKNRDIILLPTDKTETLTSDLLRGYVASGFFPVVDHGLDFDNSGVEDVLFGRYNSKTLQFWTGKTEEKWLSLVYTWRYIRFEKIVNDSLLLGKSMPLILFEPSKFYKGSRRRKTDMSLFRAVFSPVVYSPPQDENHFFPVTRYASGMSSGLFHQETEKTYCGTFYYLEPESTTFLYAENPLHATTKADAYQKLGHAPIMSRNWETETMWMKPADKWKDDMNDLDPEIQLDREFYMGEHYYAYEDDYDQLLCEAARKQGFDVVILHYMVGSRQIVEEVLDTRSRDESFANLHYLVQ